MNNKKLQFSLLAFLALVLGGAAIASIIGVHKPQHAAKARQNGLGAATAKKGGMLLPTPSLAQPSDAEVRADQDRDGEIGEVRQTRMNPTPLNMKKLVAMINTNKDTAVLSEALNTLGILAQRGVDSEASCELLARKALDKDFPARGEALLVAAIVAKDKALPVVSTILQDGGDKTRENTALLGWASRALSMIATPRSVPVIEKLISRTNDPDVLGASFAALAKAGTPEAFSLLKQQAQTGTGKTQAYGVAALSESKDPQTRQWIVSAIRDGSLGSDALSTLAIMPAAPDIFGKVFTEGGLAPGKQLDMLKEISRGFQGNPNREKLAVALAPLAYSGDVKVQEEAIKLIGRSGGRKVADIIKPLLSSEDPELRRDAFFSYVKFTSADNYKYLFDFLDDQSPEARRMAIFMVGRFYSASDRGVLEQAAQSSDAFVRDKAKQYLSSLN